MMKRTYGIQTLLNLLKQYAPVSDPYSSEDNVVIYLQDVTTHIDYYILSWDPDFMDFFALVDPLCCSNVLDLETVPLCTLENSVLFYRIYPKNKQIHWKKIYKRILPLKNGI